VRYLSHLPINVIYTKIAMVGVGGMSVQDYYAELQKRMTHAGVHDET
jgi:hypothetical protein